MSQSGLLQGWLILVALSAGTAAVTIAGADGPSRLFTGAVVLMLAGLKARIILGRYLGLARSRFWMRGFESALVLFLGLAFCVYAFATGPRP